jgi:glycolate oxidase FAD binding subunit
MTSPDQCLIDSFGPLPVTRPGSVAEVGELVRQAASQSLAVYPLGGRTELDLGLPPTKPGLAMDLGGLTGVIDYPARDMTITVQAGITLGRLGQLLRAENQRLPVDVPQPDRATLGGVLATNASGPRRYGFGTWRDYVIGLTTVNDEGHETRAGGRVVKNVAGYDLCKLHVGALGTLGIITQVTLKLRPCPDEQALIVLSSDADGLDSLPDRLHNSRTRPVCLDLLNPAAVRYINERVPALLPAEGWAVIVGFEDNRETVVWQVKQVIAEVGLGRQVETRVGAATGPLWRELTEFRAASDGGLTFKANLLPHATATFCRRATGLVDELRLQAHAGNGIVTGHAGNRLTLARAQEILKILANETSSLHGNVVVRSCPPAWKPDLPVWGAPRDDLALMHAVKEKLDPRRLFNPGRFVDGI